MTIHFGGLGDRGRSFDDQDGASAATTAISRAQFRLTEAGQTTSRGPPGVRCRSETIDLSRLAEAHVVGEDGAPPAEQERDAFDLMREESLG
jgi:hypothetical protein